MAQNTIPMSYHDRVETLFSNAQQLFNDMKEFSSNIQKEVANRSAAAQMAAASVEMPAVQTSRPEVKPVAAAPSAPVSPQKPTNQNTDPAQLVAGINLDALLNGSDLQPLQP